MLTSRRRELEGAALSLASGLHALAELWLSWGAAGKAGAAGTAGSAGAQPQERRPRDWALLVPALLAGTQCLLTCPAAWLVQAAVPELAEATLQLLSAYLVSLAMPQR